MPKKKTDQADDAVTAYLRKIGSRGGSAGTGESKRRGGSDYYRRIARKRRAKKGGSR